MESLGKQLSVAREDREISIEQAARETNITKRYLEALEVEDFSIFPGEPYLIGFLSNYAEYLGLASDKIVAQYKNIQIQEAPVPLHELVPQKPFPWIPVVITIVSAVLILAVVFFILPLFTNMKTNTQNPVTPVSQAQSYTLSQDGLSRRFYSGDTIVVPIENDTYDLEILSTSPSVSLKTEHGTQIIDLGEEIALDISATGSSDITIFVADLSKTDQSMGAEIHFKYANKTQIEQPKEATDLQSIQTVSISNTGKQTVIIDSANPYPFTLNAVFRGPCLFRYEADKKTRLEDYYESGDTVVAQANNGFTVWYSNANAVKVQIIAGGKTIDLAMGRPGQVLVQDIKWIKDADGRYKLVVIEID